MARSTEPGPGRSLRLWPLGRDQLVVLACLVALTLLAIGYLVIFAGGMKAMPAMGQMPGMPSMPGMATPTASMASGPPYGLLALMWAVMMVGMMLPSASPMILLYACVQRKAPGSPLPRTAMFLLGYILVWIAFALLAAGLQVLLTQGALISPDMRLTSRRIAGGVLILAGLYELTPLKHACLRHCRGPVAFVSAHWRPGLGGALRMGALHGGYCLGCCWALMLLLFVGGVMSFTWVFGLAALVLIQKLLPGGRRAAAITSWAIAVLAIVAAAFAFLTPA